MKTAVDNLSATLGVLTETGRQLFPRYRGGSKLSNDDSTGVIRDICRFDRRRTAAECEGEQRDCGIARTGDVEDLARASVDMMWRALILEKHHALFPECDEDELRFPLLQQSSADALKVVILTGRNIRIVRQDAGCEEC